MSKKQIEEMARLMCANYDGESGFCGDGGICDHDCWAYREATHLYDMGYRKATDVAEEIFADIEKTIADLEYQANTPRKTVKVEELKAQMNWLLHEVIPQEIAELKKKYTEGEK